MPLPTARASLSKARVVTEVSGTKRILAEYGPDGRLLRIRVLPLSRGATADLPPVTPQPRPAPQARPPPAPPEEPPAMTTPRKRLFFGKRKDAPPAEPPTEAPPAEPEPVAAPVPPPAAIEAAPEPVPVEEAPAPVDAAPVAPEPIRFDEPEPLPERAGPVDAALDAAVHEDFSLPEVEAETRHAHVDIVEEGLAAAEADAAAPPVEPMRFEIVAIERIEPAAPEPVVEEAPAAAVPEDVPVPVVEVDAPEPVAPPMPEPVVETPVAEPVPEPLAAPVEEPEALVAPEPAEAFLEPLVEAAPARPLADLVPDLERRVDALLATQDRPHKARKRAPIPVPAFEPLRREPWEERLDALLGQRA